MTPISEQEFLAVAKSEGCTAILDERAEAIAPVYVTYASSAQRLLGQKVFPPWRTTLDGSHIVPEYEVPRSEAAPIAYLDLAQKPHLFAEISFDIGKDYFSTHTIIVFHCESCGVRLVKDGNHRLLQCAREGVDRKVTVYEVRSRNWNASTIDMKNFCECIPRIAVEATCDDARGREER